MPTIEPQFKYSFSLTGQDLSASVDSLEFGVGRRYFSYNITIEISSYDSKFPSYLPPPFFSSCIIFSLHIDYFFNFLSWKGEEAVFLLCLSLPSGEGSLGLRNTPSNYSSFYGIIHREREII